MYSENIPESPEVCMEVEYPIRTQLPFSCFQINIIRNNYCQTGGVKYWWVSLASIFHGTIFYHVINSINSWASNKTKLAGSTHFNTPHLFVLIISSGLLMHCKFTVIRSIYSRGIARQHRMKRNIYLSILIHYIFCPHCLKSNYRQKRIL